VAFFFRAKQILVLTHSLIPEGYAMTHEREPGLSTLSVHGGEARVKSDYGLVDPIHCSSTYTFANTAALVAMLEGESEERDEYARYSSPNSRTVEKKLAELEGTEDAILCTTGMSALVLLFMADLKPGDKLIFFDQCYHRTRQFCFEYLKTYGVDCVQIPTGDFQALEQAMDGRTRLLFTELPTNPHLTVIDLERFVQIAKAYDAATCIDATLASPVNHLPARWGVDYIVHSATKYLGGHNDLLAGTIAGSKARLEPIRKLQGIIGAIAAPHTAWLLQRGLKTLPLRVQQQNKTGLAVAAYLNQHKAVKKVYYPGLPNHPSYEQAQKYLTGCGGLISFELKTDREGCARFIDACRIPRIGPSLGGVESLIEQPAIMSFYKASVADRQRWGIDDALVRLSLGIEDTQDLLSDLDQALNRI
jgi:cystathionine gamma-synthase